MATITLETVKKIKGHHNANKLSQRFAEGGGIDVINQMTTMEHVYGEKTAISKDEAFNNVLFVVGKKMVFKGRAVDEHYYVVYAYNLDGGFIKEIESEKLIPKFFDNLIYLE